MSHFVALSLGANLNNPLYQLISAIGEIKAHPEISSVSVSSFYRTKPIGPAQPDFLNIAITLQTTLSPLDLLTAMQAIEESHLRTRTLRWGPRTLDIDLLLYNDVTIDTERLTLPHPRMQERAFVIVPLLEIAPTLTLPGGTPLQSLLSPLSDQLTDIHLWEIPSMHQLVIASHNAGKVAEFKTLLAPLGIEVLSLSDLNINSEAEETGLTFVENALLKARHIAEITHLPTLADDSGLVVDALGGAPGIYSARYSAEKTDTANNALLLKNLAETGDTERRAHFKCVLVLLQHANDPVPIISEGEVYGTILDAPSGENGFGYDPLFFFPPLNKSFAEVTPDEKNRNSHRGKALMDLIAKLNQRFG